MSSFLVEDKTINTVVTYLSTDRHDWMKREIKKELGFDLDTHEGRKALGGFMFMMNIDALIERYDSAEGFRPLDYEFQFQPYYTDFTALKCLSCWLYQCAEGEVYQRKEYKFFEQLRGDIAYRIVNKLKEYEMAQGWA